MLVIIKNIPHHKKLKTDDIALTLLKPFEHQVDRVVAFLITKSKHFTHLNENYILHKTKKKFFQSVLLLITNTFYVV